MSSVSLVFEKVPAAFGYDIYRSASPIDMGTRINILTIPQPGGITVSYTDDVTNSTTPPMVGNTYWYRAVALDMGGNKSLPSSAVMASVSNQAYVQSDLRQNVIAYLKADPTLMSMLGGTDDLKIRSRNAYLEMRNDVPFLVVEDGEFVENNRIKEPCFRHGMQPMHFEAYDDEQASQKVENILNRVAALLRDNATGGGGRRHVSSNSVRVHFAVPKGGYQEFYDEGVRLGGKRLVVEFTVRMKQT